MEILIITALILAVASLFAGFWFWGGVADSIAERELGIRKGIDVDLIGKFVVLVLLLFCLVQVLGTML